MKANTLLIVIDENEKIRSVADRIAACFPGKRVILRSGEAFSPTDLLPADAYFFGCDKPEPSGFAELARMLRGVNLVGRPCGLFSTKTKAAVDYLRLIVRDADLRLNPVPYFADSSDDLTAWTAATLQGN